MEILTKAEKLKTELDSLRPLDAEAEARIMQKFRLEWNYHSNHLEGNSLNFGETKALILFDKAVGDKNFKDYEEMRDHNSVIKFIEESSKDGTELSEKFIREIHQLLLKKSHYKEAQTLDGKLTSRKIEVGKYKTQPNHVLTVTGETFYFATPEETPAKMQELVEWFRKEKEKSDVNPIILAALFHYRFIRIHPFDDGNGRVARILMNFILMQFGCPPAIIKTEDKENYYTVLRLADADEIEPFIEYIGQNLIRSLEIMIKGAKGEDIEEPDDLDKELALLEHRLKAQTNDSEIEKTQENLLFFFDNSIVPLFLELGRVSQKFARFYYENKSVMLIDSNGISDMDENKISFEMRERLNTSNFFIKLQHDYRRFKTGDNINYEIWLEMKLDPKKIIVKNSDNQIILEKSYSNQFSEEEIKMLVSFEAKKHKDFIEKQLEKKLI